MIIPGKGNSLSDFMASLIIDFPNDNISVFKNDENWKLSACFLSQESSFAKNGVPTPYGFKNRTEWEQAVFQTMASYS